MKNEILGIVMIVEYIEVMVKFKDLVNQNEEGAVSILKAHGELRKRIENVSTFVEELKMIPESERTQGTIVLTNDFEKLKQRLRLYLD